MSTISFDTYTELRKAIEVAGNAKMLPHRRMEIYAQATRGPVIKQLLADYDRVKAERNLFKAAFEQLTTDTVALAMRKRGSDERSIGAHQAANEIIDKAAELNEAIRRACDSMGASR